MESRVSFEKLKGRENFTVWRVGAKAHFITKGVWDEFAVEEKDLKNSDGQFVATKVKPNERALAELTLLLDPSVYTYIENCVTVKDAWEALSKAFEDKGVVRKVTLLKQFISLKLSDYDDIQEYVNQCLTLRSKVKSAGFDLSEDVAASIILCGLPDDYRPLVMGIELKTTPLNHRRLRYKCVTTRNSA